MRLAMHSLHGRIPRTLLIVAALAFATGTALAAGKQEYKFTNPTPKSHASDLHIEFDGPVSWPAGNPNQTPPGTFATSNGNGTQNVDLAEGFTGTGVGPGGSVVVSLDFGANKPPKVKKAWWTKGNTLTPAESDSINVRDTGTNRHLLREDPKIRNSWVMAPATGNGLVHVVIDGVPHPFQPLPGDDGVATAERFADFLEATQFGTALFEGKAVCYSTSHIREGQPHQILILQQDETQTMTTGLSPTPGISPEGMWVLLVIMLASAVFFLLRRRPAVDSI